MKSSPFNDFCREIIEDMLEGFQIIDSEYRYTYLNKVALRHARKTEQELIGKTMMECYPSIEETEMFRNITQCMELNRPINMENQFRYPDGREAWYELRMEPIPDGVFILSVDVTKRKEAEDHNEYLYQTLSAIRSVNKLIVTEKDRDTLLQRTCDLMVESKGYNQCRIITVDEEGKLERIYSTGSETSHEAKNIDEYSCISQLNLETPTIFSSQSSTCKSCLQYFSVSDNDVLGMVLGYKKKIYGYFIAEAPLDKTGAEEISLFKEVVGDVSYALQALDVEEERRKSVIALGASEKRYRKLLDSGMDGIVVNVLGKIAYANSRIIEMLGYSEDELIGSSILDYHRPEYKTLVRERTQLRHDGVEVPSYYEVELVRKDGVVLPVSYSISRILFEGEPASLTYIQDMTEIKRFEKRLAAVHRSAIDLWNAQTIEDAFAIARQTLSNTMNFDRYGITKVVGEYLESTHEVDGKKHRFPLHGGSIVGRTARLKKTQFIRDTRNDPDYNIGPRTEPCLSEIATPIIVQDEVIAVMNVESLQVDAYDEQDVRLVETLAMHVSLAIGHIKNNEENEEFTKKLEALHNYAVNSIEAQTLEQLTDLTIDALYDVLDFHFCEISQVNQDTVDIIKSSHQGFFDGLPLDGPGIVIRAIKTGETQNIPDIRLDPDYVDGGKRDDSGKVFNILSELAVPIKIGKKVRLLINVESTKTNAFSWRDQRLTEILATHTASAFEIIQEQDQIVAYTHKLEALYRIIESLPSSESIDEIAERIKTTINDIIGFDLASFGLVKGNVLYHQYIWGTKVHDEFILPLDGPGITVRAVNTGETQLVQDTSLEAIHINPIEAGVSMSELCVPVKKAGKVVAVINIESRTLWAFDQQDVSLLSILAEHVGSTMHNLELRENEREFTRRLEALSRIGASMNAASSIKELANIALDIIEEIMGIPFCSFGIVEEDKLVVIGSRGEPLDRMYMPLGGPGITIRAIKEKQTMLVNDTRLDSDFVRGSTDSLSELAVPIILENQVIGMINMETLELNYFDSTHRSLAETLAANVASNIQRLHREEATRKAEIKAIREQEKAEHAVELDKLKTNFIRTATHEIRTPLTSIIGYTELAKAKLENGNSPELERYLEVISRNSERLDSLSADLLDVQRIESGRLALNKAPVYTREILEDLNLEMKPILESRDQELIITGDDYQVNVDRIRIMQVFVNLVSNASKFSPKGSSITLKIEKDDDQLKASVQDEGVGIREEDIPKLFKPFPGIRVEGVTNTTGLGLSICKGLIELHRGKIWVESEGIGKGSRFIFTCPCL